eukprot:m51a1_g2429 hypothetical protein (315) ;mRNA; r:837322-838313
MNTTAIVLAVLLGLVLLAQADCDLPYGWSNVFVTNHLRSRRALVYRPKRQSEFAKPSLWLHLHGITMAPEDHLFLYRFHTVAEMEGSGYIFAAPEGTGRYWDTIGNEDVDFMKVLAKSLQDRGCGDPQRTYLSGFSLGSSLTFTVACRAPGVFAAIAPTALPRYGYNLGRCNIKTPVWYWSGTLDPIGNPMFVSAEQCFQWWAKHNGCTASNAATETMKLSLFTIKCKKAVCPNQAFETNLCMSQGTSHAWIWGSEETIWAFFKRHPLTQVTMVDNTTDAEDYKPVSEAPEAKSGASTLAVAGVLGFLLVLSAL